MSEAFEPAIRNTDSARHISPRPSSGSAFAIALGGLVALAVGIGVGRFVQIPSLAAAAALVAAAALTVRLRS